MKRFPKLIIALLLSVLTALMLPAQVFADSAPEYISEVKVYIGSCDKAESEGFTILCDKDNNPVDLNQNAGGGMGSKGEKAVYLGYKTTSDKKDAVTDLALMNMKGGYSVKEYEALMEQQLKAQILPFIENFKKAIAEYRANYESDNEANKARADYVHDALNMLYDDDTEQFLGDLLLNPTRQELGEEAYNALSEEEKKQHADLAVIIAQANGNATLIMENLITRAADTNDDTWLERFEGLTYDNLIEETGQLPSDAGKTLAKLYDDDAQEILFMWGEFKEHLDNFDKAVQTLDEENEKDFSEEEALIENFDFDNASDEEYEAYAEAVAKITTHTEIVTNCTNDIICHEYLDSIGYGEGTMLDFFLQERAEISDDITALYPLVASLSEGQRAGLEFVTLQDLVLFGIADSEGYKSASLEELEPSSIYLGIDRAIYEKGGVALTSDALRQDVTEVPIEERSLALTVLAGVSGGLAIVSAAICAVSRSMKNTAIQKISTYVTTLDKLERTIQSHEIGAAQFMKHIASDVEWMTERGDLVTREVITGKYNFVINKHAAEMRLAQEEYSKIADPEFVSRMEARSATCSKMMVGAAVMTVVMVVISGILVYLDYQAMKEYYKVEFTPIPHYMVDEQDITAYNKKGEKVIIKNHSAYYKAAESNRASDAEFYETLGTCADLNGDVGSQWLALYVNKNEVMDPILADSLVAVVDSTEIPSGYKTGIHMFGSEAAFNLNNPLYDWNQKAPGVYVYFKTDDGSAPATGTNLSGGSAVIIGAAGAAVGAVATGIISNKRKKKDVA